MKRLTYLLFAVVALCACNNEHTEDKPHTTIEKMNAEFITDVWSLYSWSSGLAEGMYCYMIMDGESGHYEMWDNLNSMYPNYSTGTFTLSKVDERDYITGTYDNGVGDWNDSYELVIYDFEYLDWISQSTGEVMRWRRIFELPDIENN